VATASVRKVLYRQTPRFWVPTTEGGLQSAKREERQSARGEARPTEKPIINKRPAQEARESPPHGRWGSKAVGSRSARSIKLGRKAKERIDRGALGEQLQWPEQHGKLGKGVLVRKNKRDNLGVKVSIRTPKANQRQSGLKKKPESCW